MRRKIYELDKMKAHYPEEQILFLRYEDFFNNFDFIFHKIEKFLDIKITPELKETIVQKYNLSAQKKEAEKFEDSREYDQVRHIYGYHIMNGRPQTWKKLTDPKHYFLLNEGDMTLSLYVQPKKNTQNALSFEEAFASWKESGETFKNNMNELFQTLENQ